MCRAAQSSSRFLATFCTGGGALICLILAACGTQRQESDADYSDTDYPDVGVCPAWEEMRSEKVQVADGLTYYTRPYFTTCENGQFFREDWQFYSEGIERYSPEELGQTIVCPSGECKWGMCKEDAEYIEAQFPKGATRLSGRLSLENSRSKTFNLQSVLYTPTRWDDDHYWACEGGGCCESAAESFDGPCLAPQWFWTVNVQSDDFQDQIFLDMMEIYYASEGANCLEDAWDWCGLENNTHCLAGTVALSQMELSGAAYEYAFALSIAGEWIYADRVHLVMGTQYGLFSFQANHGSCPSDFAASSADLSFFTCSGTAQFHIVDGRWFQAAWIQKYDPSRCDKPCWMAREAPVDVEFAIWQLDGEPK